MGKFVDEIIKFGRKLGYYGLVQANAGNISIKISSDKLLITRTKAMLDELEEKDIVEVGLVCSSELDEVASSELDMHRQIYLYNLEANAVVHAHPQFGVIMSLSNSSVIYPQDKTAQVILPQIPILEDIEDKKDLAHVVANKLKEYKGLLLRGHGSVTIGKTLEEAYLLTCFIENSCKINYFLNKHNLEDNK